MSKPILALNSIRGKSGKDTLIEQMTAQGLKVHRVAFADILKKECAEALTADECLARPMERCMRHSEKDVPREHLAIAMLPTSGYRDWLSHYAFPADEDYYKYRSLRWHLQQYGTEYVRQHLGKPNYWLDQGILEVLNGASDPSVDVVVVTDMRLPNEYAQLSRMGAHLIRIVRTWHVPEVDTVPFHISDIALMADPFDALVVNDWGKPEAMFDQIKRFL